MEGRSGSLPTGRDGEGLLLTHRLPNIFPPDSRGIKSRLRPYVTCRRSLGFIKKEFILVMLQCELITQGDGEHAVLSVVGVLINVLERIGHADVVAHTEHKVVPLV